MLRRNSSTKDHVSVVVASNPLIVISVGNLSTSTISLRVRYLIQNAQVHQLRSLCMHMMCLTCLPLVILAGYAGALPILLILVIWGGSHRIFNHGRGSYLRILLS